MSDFNGSSPDPLFKPNVLGLFTPHRHTATAPIQGGKLVSQKIGGCMTCRSLEVVLVYRIKVVGLPQLAASTVCEGNGCISRQRDL